MTPGKFYALLGSVFGYSAQYGPKFHAGQDYPWGKGTAIPAPADARVVATGTTAEAGNYITLLFGGKYVLFYHLLSRPTLKIGSYVEYGDTIGLVGTTGDSSGYHVHVAVSSNSVPGLGSRIDPVPFLSGYLKGSTTAGSGGTIIDESKEIDNMGDIQYYERTGSRTQEWMIAGRAIEGGYIVTTNGDTARMWGRQYVGKMTTPIFRNVEEYKEAQAFWEDQNLKYQAEQIKLIKKAMPAAATVVAADFDYAKMAKAVNDDAYARMKS